MVPHRDRSGGKTNQPRGFGPGAYGGNQHGFSGDPWSAYPQWGNPPSLDIITRDFLAAFSHEYDPIDAAITYLGSLKGQQQYMQQPQQQQQVFSGYDAYGQPQQELQGQQGMGQGMSQQGLGQNYDQTQAYDQYPPQEAFSGTGVKRFRSGASGAPTPGENGNWLCPRPQCANVNFPKRTHCNRCQTPKPGLGLA